MEDKLELLYKVINTIGKGIIFVDDANKFVFFNRAAGELLNVKPEERIGTSIFHCHPKKMEEKVEQRIDQFRKDPQLQTKGRIINYQGKYLRETFYSVSDEQGKYLGIAGVFEDVKEMVSLLKELDKFEEPPVFGSGDGRPRSPLSNNLKAKGSALEKGVSADENRQRGGNERVLR